MPKPEMTMGDVQKAREKLADDVLKAADEFYAATGMRPEIQIQEQPRQNPDDAVRFTVHVRATLS